MSQNTYEQVHHSIIFIPFILITFLGFYLGRLSVMGITTLIRNWTVIFVVGIVGVALILISSRLLPNVNRIWDEKLPFWTSKGLGAMIGLFLIGAGIMWTLMAITPVIGFVIYEF